MVDYDVQTPDFLSGCVLKKKTSSPFPEDPWHVYLLECADGTFYCGVSKDLRRRLEQHNGDLPGGAKYTAGRRPVRVLASRLFGCKGDALRFEMKVKSCPRMEKLELFGPAGQALKENA